MHIARIQLCRKMLFEHFGEQYHKPLDLVQPAHLHSVTKQVQHKHWFLCALHMSVHVHDELVQNGFTRCLFHQGQNAGIIEDDAGPVFGVETKVVEPRGGDWGGRGGRGGGHLCGCCIRGGY